MPAVNLHVEQERVATLDRLFEIARELFPGQTVIHFSGQGFHVELDDEMAEYLLDCVRLSTECRGFEPFSDWQNQQRKQLMLDLTEEADRLRQSGSGLGKSIDTPPSSQEAQSSADA